MLSLLLKKRKEKREMEMSNLILSGTVGSWLERTSSYTIRGISKMLLPRGNLLTQKATSVALGSSKTLLNLFLFYLLMIFLITQLLAANYPRQV